VNSKGKHEKEEFRYLLFWSLDERVPKNSGRSISSQEFAIKVASSPRQPRLALTVDRVVSDNPGSIKNAIISTMSSAD
jgi:hypothetical protein